MKPRIYTHAAEMAAALRRDRTNRAFRRKGLRHLVLFHDFLDLVEARIDVLALRTPGWHERLARAGVLAGMLAELRERRGWKVAA